VHSDSPISVSQVVHMIPSQLEVKAIFIAGLLTCKTHTHVAKLERLPSALNSMKQIGFSLLFDLR